MNNTVYKLTATHNEVVGTLIALYFEIEDPNTPISWRAVLNVLRRLEKDCQQHRRVLAHYRHYYEDSHWTIRIVIDSIIRALRPLSDQEEALRTRLQSFLAGDKTVTDEDLKHLATTLLRSYRTPIEIEKRLLFKMLRLLDATKLSTNKTEPGLQLVGA